MQHKSLTSALYVLILIVGVAACGADRQAGTPGPVVVASPQPSSTPSPVPPSATPLPTDAPTLVSPSATPLPTETSALPQATDTPTSPPLEPTSTPRPTATPLQAADPSALRVELQKVVGGLDTPVGIAHAGDGSGRLFIVEKPGRIRIVRDGSLLPTPFLDISDRVGSSSSEQGLLGLAFHPDYAASGLFFVNYTDRNGDTVISRFAVSDAPGQANPASEVVLLTLAQPAANHNGGHLAFGPDGYLYIGTGDGGASGDKFGNGQNGQTLLGAMLRLDVDAGTPYAIPPNNPFVGDPNVRDEIWTIGLRNPWRYSFDRQTGELYIADVGQNVYEEVNLQAAGSPGGQNYGWPIMEAAHCYPENQACDRSGLTLPVIEYTHAEGCSVTGGYVYRGREFPLLAGVYLFGDYCSGRIWGLAPSAGGWAVAQLAQVDARISSFGEDEAGELYLVDMAAGSLYRITAQHR